MSSTAPSICKENNLNISFPDNGRWMPIEESGSGNGSLINLISTEFYYFQIITFK